MKTLLYFQSNAKTSADEKLGGVQSIAAKCGWHVQIIDGIPSAKKIKSLVSFWNPVGAIVECGGTATTLNPSPSDACQSFFSTMIPRVFQRTPFA